MTDRSKLFPPVSCLDCFNGSPGLTHNGSGITFRYQKIFVLGGDMARYKRGTPYVDVVGIVWTDAVKHDDDHRQAEPAVGMTMGTIVDADSDRIKIASEQFSDGDCRDVTAIPRGMVQRIIKIKRVYLPEFAREDH